MSAFLANKEKTHKYQAKKIRLLSKNAKLKRYSSTTLLPVPTTLAFVPRFLSVLYWFQLWSNAVGKEHPSLQTPKTLAFWWRDLFDHFEQISWRWCRHHWEWNFGWFKNLHMVKCQKIRMISHKTWTETSCTVESQSSWQDSVILTKQIHSNSVNSNSNDSRASKKGELTSMRSCVFHFNVVIFNTSKADWKKRPLLHNGTMAEATQRFLKFHVS